MQRHELYFRAETNGLFALASISETLSRQAFSVGEKLTFLTHTPLEPGEQAFVLSCINASTYCFNIPMETMPKDGAENPVEGDANSP